MPESFYRPSETLGINPVSYQRRFQDDLLNLIPREARTMLDLGCGDGFITSAVADRSMAVGMDISMKARTLSRHGWEVTVIAATAPPGNTLDEETFPEIRIIRIDLRRVVHIPLDGQYPDDAIPGCRIWKESNFYHNHFNAQAVQEKASVNVAYDLPVLPSALLAARQLGAKINYDSHNLYAEQSIFSPEASAMYSATEDVLANDSPELKRFVSSQSVDINHPMRSADEIAAGFDLIFASDLLSMRTALSEISTRFVWAEQEEKLANHFEQVFAAERGKSGGMN